MIGPYWYWQESPGVFLPLASEYMNLGWGVAPTFEPPTLGPDCTDAYVLTDGLWVPVSHVKGMFSDLHDLFVDMGVALAPVWNDLVSAVSHVADVVTAVNIDVGLVTSASLIGESGTGDHPGRMLRKVIPALDDCWVPCPSERACRLKLHGETELLDLEEMIVHLNDVHLWTRERIADWLDTLEGVDLTFQPAQIGD